MEFNGLWFDIESIGRFVCLNSEYEMDSEISTPALLLVSCFRTADRRDTPMLQGPKRHHITLKVVVALLIV